MHGRAYPIYCLALASVLAVAGPIALEGEDLSAIPSASAPAILEDDPSALLGMGIGESIARLGAPSSVFALRGDAAWQDDVAFVYGTGYTLFMYRDRLWQIRFTKSYVGSIYGLFLGDGSDKALSVLGQPYESGLGFLVFRMPFKSYPVRLRLALQDEKIVDAYLFRADF